MMWWMLFSVVKRKAMRKRQTLESSTMTSIVAIVIIKAFAFSALGSPRMESVYLMTLPMTCYKLWCNIARSLWQTSRWKVLRMLVLEFLLPGAATNQEQHTSWHGVPVWYACHVYDFLQRDTCKESIQSWQFYNSQGNVNEGIVYTDIEDVHRGVQEMLE